MSKNYRNKKKNKNKQIKLSYKKQVEFDILYLNQIGKKIEIVESNNSNQIGLKGTLIYESSSLFFLKIDNKIKKIFKDQIKFKIEYEDKKLLIDGKLFSNSIVNRIKKIK